MSIRGASSLRHPFQDLCRKLESRQNDPERLENYPSGSEIWKFAPEKSDNEFLSSRQEGEVS
ncbi:hypothetical protein [Leptospira saintgironsiae]|uniref:Uncharacterized protein n=1 Tax=Leptospira saintgironsiae TaxID=2023183 RepID=A0A2M9YAB3_9LEPT|nr:hypothetical protein [Leptospira saintgironsiae]PJZ48376.1 hypothetical protein CH362_14260 [Leptospira saintgironsiae]